MRSEKKALQMTVAIACMVPIIAGFSGIFQGAGMLGGGNIDMDSHFRYLSGLLLAIGLCFLSMVPRIEHHTKRARLLTLIVIIGGIARLIGLLSMGTPGTIMLAALLMELVITPALCLWQNSFARRWNSGFY